MSSYLQVILPLVACAISLLYLSIQIIQRTVKIKYAKNNEDWRSSKVPISGNERYRDDPDEPDQYMDVREDDESAHLALHPTKSNTHDSLIELSRPRGQYWVVVIETVLLLAQLGVNLAVMVSNAWGHKGIVAAIAGLVTWGYILVLVSLRLLAVRTRLPSLPNIWYHTAFLYGVQWILVTLLFRSAIIHPR